MANSIIDNVKEKRECDAADCPERQAFQWTCVCGWRGCGFPCGHNHFKFCKERPAEEE